MKVHETGKCYQCASCLKTYMTSAALTSHMMLHKKLSESSIRDLRCQQCGDKLSSTEELQVTVCVSLTQHTELENRRSVKMPEICTPNGNKGVK